MLCSTGEEGFDLSYNSLTSESAKKALAERIKNSQAFSMTLSRAEPMGVENDEDSARGDLSGPLYPKLSTCFEGARLTQLV